MPAGTFPVCHIQISISEPGKSLISSTLSYDVCHHEGCVLSTNKRAPNEENAAHFFSILTFTVKTHIENDDWKEMCSKSTYWKTLQTFVPIQ